MDIKLYANQLQTWQNTIDSPTQTIFCSRGANQIGDLLKRLCRDGSGCIPIRLDGKLRACATNQDINIIIFNNNLQVFLNV